MTHISRGGTAHGEGTDPRDDFGLATDVLRRLESQALRVAVAESVTGGLVSAMLTSVPGASACFRGGVVAYDEAAKAKLLRVSRRLLATFGPVDPQVAVQMARGAADVFAADVAVSTTGAAGPATHGGATPGTVYIGWWTSRGSGALRCEFAGNRDRIRRQATRRALEFLGEVDLAGRSETGDNGDWTI